MYKDIINLPHHVSATRPQMSMADRAAQFSPFAALTGYDAAIDETGRLTDAKIEIGEETQGFLNRKFGLLLEKLGEYPEVSILYFLPDSRKAGGAYICETGVIKKVDDYERLLIMQDGTKIPMDDILSIDGEIFEVLL